MKPITIFYTILLFVFISPNRGYAQADTEKDSLLIWSKNRKLTWNDFQGVNKNSSFIGAKSSVGINLEPYLTGYNSYEYIVLAYFYKKESPTNVNESYILKHEQLHFDIAELFARKIRKAIADLKKAKVLLVEDYQSIYKDLYSQFDKYQDLYDSETNHGTIYKKQKEWEACVVKELEALKEYDKS